MLEAEEAIDRLDRDIRRLKIDFERFFNGNLKVPPELLRQSISTQIQELRSRHIRTFALRFRVNNLEARFHIFSVFFARRLRAMEWGAGGAASSATAGFDPREGVILGENPEPEAVRALYRELCRARQAAPAADFTQFQAYLAKRVAQIRSKTGCSHVRFRIASEGGRVKLKAKPVSSS